MASVTKRGTDRWKIQVYMGRTAQGKSLFKSKTIVAPHTREGRQAAMRAATEFETECFHDLPPRFFEVKSFGDLVQQWIDVNGHTWSATHRSTTIQRWRKHSGRLASVPPMDLTARDLDEHYFGLRSTGLSAASVQRFHAIVSGALNLGVEYGYVNRNVAARRRPKDGRSTRRETIPTDEQVRRAWAHDDPWWGATLRLAIGTGMRRGELCGLRWDDLAGDRLHVERSVYSDGGKVLVGPTKGNRSRSISLSPATIAALEAHRANEVQKWGDSLGPWIFHRFGSPTEPMPPTSITGWWSHHRDDLGCHGVRWHDWRHRAAITMLGAGIDAYTVAARLGHDPAVLLRTYAHFMPARDRLAADAIDDIIGDPPVA